MGAGVKPGREALEHRRTVKVETVRQRLRFIILGFRLILEIGIGKDCVTTLHLWG